jgi:S1-C subfamily serine protease
MGLALLLLTVAALATAAQATEPRTYGTGFVVHPDGFLLTSAQIAAGAKSLQVTCPDRPKVAAVVDHLVPRLDTAVIRIPQDNLPYLSLALSISVSEMVLVGDTVGVVVYLNAPGGKPALMPGVATVTALAGPGDAPEYFQLAMPADRRDPGAPVVSSRGDVIGLLTTAAAMRGFVDPATPPSPNVTWMVKAQTVRLLIVNPPPQPTTRSLDEAVARARQSTCLIEFTR